MKWSARADGRLVEAVIAAFTDPPECSYERLSICKEQAWIRSYHWLDASGMTLYFLDRIETLGIQKSVPATTLARFKQNLEDNRNRNSVMYEEFVSINQAFQGAGIQYANLKGFTLSPECCPDPSLRCQLDLDFLVDGNQLDLCREILSRTGYLLTAATEQTWEFKAGDSTPSSIDDLYKPQKQRSVELHFTFPGSSQEQSYRDRRLDRLTWRLWNGHAFPVLSPTDQFIAQALHLYGHICSPWTRLSWFLEYRHYLLARYDDKILLADIKQQSTFHRHSDIAIGLATLLSSRFFGANAPAELNAWTLDALPAPAKLWADQYGRRSLLADFPGTKLYLLLQEELTSDDGAWRVKKRRSLLPLHSAPKITLAKLDDDLWARLRGKIYQARFNVSRARFHVIEGLRYIHESIRWRGLLHTLNITNALAGRQPTSDES
jgi:Uncharacterised nucleotidyltransferase